MKNHTIPSFALLSLFITGCAVGPDYKAPTTQVPAAFQNAENTGPLEQRWWLTFDDATLNDLIAQALASNYDLKIAQARILEARANNGISTLNQLPIVTSRASATSSRNSENLLQPGMSTPIKQDDNDTFIAGFDATWELDIWGRVRREKEASRADLRATEDQRRDVLVTLLAEVARNYIQLRSVQQEIDIAEKNVVSQGESLKLTNSLMKGGRATALDVSRAEALLHSTQANIPRLRVSEAAAIHRLGVLTGQAPENLLAKLSTREALPGAKFPLAVGFPSDILRRRPDIRAAEANLQAATARIGVAVGDLFPKFVFNGSVTLQSSQLGTLLSGNSRASSFGPAVSWPALDIFRTKYRVDAANAREQATLAQYQKTVLTALEETENALVNHSRSVEQTADLEKATASQTEAVRLSRLRFEKGLESYLTVLDAQRALYTAEDQLALSRASTLTSLIAAYKAVGGGWEAFEAAPVASAQ